MPSHFGTVEGPEEAKLGISCSGGGIRSAAFSLGALQALQEKGEMRKAAYLAAVSGGSYIAAAISMVAKTGPGNSDAALLKRTKAFAPGSPEEQYLRNRCSYLAPTLSDQLYLGWRIVLGLLVNLAFLSMPLIGVSLILTGLLYAPFVSELAGQCEKANCAASMPTWFWAAPLGTLGASALFGVATLIFRWRHEAWERFFAVWATRLLVAAGVLGLVLVGLPYLVDWLDHLAKDGTSVVPSVEGVTAALGAGFGALLAGVAVQLGHLITSKKAVEEMGRIRKAFSKLGAGTRLTVAYAAGALVGPLLLLAVAALTVAEGMAQAPSSGGVDGVLVAIGVGVLMLFALLYRFADLMTWSLHPFYKRRLSSAFALKRISERDLDSDERNRVEALRDPCDPNYSGIAVERDYDRLVQLSKTALTEEETKGEWPTLLVCAAANVSNPGATPPGRRITSFTFSAYSVGGPLVGAIPTTTLEGAFDSAGRRLGRRRRGDLTLLAAVAMSGAAISPSMGKMTPRPLTFLMALANLRLGVWVPNPRWVAEVGEDEAPPRRYARPRPLYLLRELLGRNRIDARYLYVTDGGHYENLGLVELLRRGCTEIYCLDASGIGEGKAEFKELGDAIALARSELGVEIEFGKTDPQDLTPDEKTRVAKRDTVTGRITYPKQGPNGEQVTGKLVYVRNTMTGDVPWDVRAYHKEDPRFPNNPTVDQLYTDQKFEAYRVLGVRAGDRAFAEMKAK